MKADRIEALIDAAGQLGHHSIEVMIDMPHDGGLFPATAELRVMGDQRESYTVLVVTREGTDS